MSFRIGIIVFNVTLSAGTERAAVNLANNLAGNGHSVTIISICSQSGMPFFALNERVKIEHLGIITGKSLWKRFLFNYLQIGHTIARLVKNEKWTLIGTTHAINFIIAGIKKFRRSIKVVGCEHIAYEAVPAYSRKFRNFIYRKLDAIVTLTEEDQAHFLSTGLKKCYTIPNEISFFPKEPSTCDKPQLLAIGRFTFQKGFDLLIDLVAKPLKNHPEWKLNIIGQGELEQEHRKQIANLGLTGQIHLVAPTKEIEQYYLGSSLYLMSSRFEGMPMVLLEAKACGLPIIAYDCPHGPRQLIRENDGRLIEMNNAAGFSEALVALMENEKERKNLGKQARINVAPYSAPNIYARWQSLFDRL